MCPTLLDQSYWSCGTAASLWTQRFANQCLVPPLPLLTFDFQSIFKLPNDKNHCLFLCKCQEGKRSVLGEDCTEQSGLISSLCWKHVTVSVCSKVLELVKDTLMKNTCSVVSFFSFTICKSKAFLSV